jgi:hypothetical protein
MIDSLNVENFRCFRKLELRDLKQINVVVGQNGSGKTSLFESIYLAAGGHPVLALRIRGWRGLGELISVTLARQDYEVLWRDLFHALNHHKPIQIELKGSAENSRTLKIYYSSEGEQVTLSLGSEPQDSTIIIPIVFEYLEGPDGTRHKFIVELGSEGLVIKGASQAMKTSYFSAANRPSPQETAKRYSDLSKKKAQAKFMDLFKEIYPEIKSLSVEVIPGNISLLYGEVEYLPEKVPLTLISDGAYRLASSLRHCWYGARSSVDRRDRKWVLLQAHASYLARTSGIC